MASLSIRSRWKNWAIGAMLACLTLGTESLAVEPGRTAKLPVAPISVKFLQPDLNAQAVDALGIRQPPRQVEDDLPRRRETDCKHNTTSKRLDEISTMIAPTGDLLPPDCSEELFTRPGLEYVDLRRQASITPFEWEASGICLRPTYFDDVPLERYGQTLHPAAQPFISSACFFTTVPLMPYRMTLAPPYRCRYTLGYHRPGDAAPCYYPWLPWDTRAALVQGATIAGFVLIFP